MYRSGQLCTFKNHRPSFLKKMYNTKQDRTSMKVVIEYHKQIRNVTKSCQTHLKPL